MNTSHIRNARGIALRRSSFVIVAVFAISLVSGAAWGRAGGGGGQQRGGGFSHGHVGGDHSGRGFHDGRDHHHFDHDVIVEPFFFPPDYYYDLDPYPYPDYANCDPYSPYFTPSYCD
jgi:hypothetical protein